MKRFSDFSLLLVSAFFTLLMPKALLSQLPSSGQSWQPTNSESAYPIYQFVSHQDHLYAAFYGAGVFKTADEGETWTACHTGLTNFLARDLVLAGDNLFVGTNRGGVFKSADEGQSWQTANDTVLHKSIWSLLATENRLFAGTSNGLFFTDDAGNSWQQADLPRPKAPHQIIFSLAVKGRSILAGSNSHVYLSDDFGETWQQIKVPTRFDIMTIEVQEEVWLLGTSGAGILSSKNGVDWNVWNKNAGNTRSMILTDNSLILGLSGQGVVDASDRESFGNLNEGFTNPSIRSVGYHKDKLYAGTYKQGIWRYDIPQADFIPPISTQKIATDVTIYPNPVENGLVTLTYHLAENANVHIQLFDAFGKKVAQVAPLAEQYKGAHQIGYNMTELGGGTYYFHLQLGDRLITKPIVLIHY